MLDFIQKLGGDMPGGFFVYRADEGEEILYLNDIVLDIFGCDTREEFDALTGGSSGKNAFTSSWSRKVGKSFSVPAGRFV